MAKDMPYTPYTGSTLQRLAALEPRTLAHCYVTTASTTQFGIIVLAFVFSSYDLDTPVREALAVAGLDPEREEFKSGVRIDRNPAMQAARAQLIAVIRKHAHVGVVIARRHHIVLCKQCLQALCQEAVIGTPGASSL